MRFPSSKRLNFPGCGSVILTKAIDKHSTLNAQVIQARGQLKLKMDQNEIITFATTMRLPGQLLQQAVAAYLLRHKDSDGLSGGKPLSRESQALLILFG